MKKKLIPENEIDEIIVAQANDKDAWTESEYIKKPAKRGSREKFLEALSKVPKVTPEEGDKIE